MAATKADLLLLEGETWESAAWLLFTAGGVKQYKQIRDALKTQFPDAPKDCRTVAAGIGRISQAVKAAQAEGLIDANSEYISSLEAALQEAWKLWRTADNDNARIAAMKLIVDLLEKIAAAKGVVTQRSRQEQTGAGGGPVQTQVVGVADVIANERAAQAACDLEEALASSSDTDAGGVCEEPQSG